MIAGSTATLGALVTLGDTVTLGATIGELVTATAGFGDSVVASLGATETCLATFACSEVEPDERLASQIPAGMSNPAQANTAYNKPDDLLLGGWGTGSLTTPMFVIEPVELVGMPSETRVPLFNALGWLPASMACWTSGRSIVGSDSRGSEPPTFGLDWLLSGGCEGYGEGTGVLPGMRGVGS